jgi:demethylmenaquinone methyltransferase/2-methoxy-6-polyprenyl-1,4-benzoquinol methylase
MSKDILQEQIDYYRARAQEYDASLQPMEAPQDEIVEQESRDFAEALAKVSALPPVENILELAGGTGIWTEQLVKQGQSITVVDASPEMLAINREKVGDPRVEYVCADLFTWKPERTYDRVFFAFWLSHVPPDKLDAFLDTARDAVRLGGQAVIVDQSGATPEELTVTSGIQQERTLADGRQFTIVKVYYDPVVIQEKLTARGFGDVTYHKGDYFFYLSGQRSS